MLYARFIGDAVDYVLNQLIETMLVKDRDFVAWRQEHPHEVATEARYSALSRSMCWNSYRTLARTSFAGTNVPCTVLHAKTARS